MTRMKIMVFKMICGCLLLFSFIGNSYAFYCTNGSQTVDWTAEGSITTYIDAVSLNKNITDILLTNLNAYAYCNGSPIPNYEDALRTNSITLSNSLTTLGFTAYIKSFGGPAYTSPPNQVCIWPDSNCTVSGSVMDITKPINAQIGMSRVSGSGNWRAGAKIFAGQEIFRMNTQMRYIGGAWGRSYDWIFVLKNDMVVPAYTCSITQFDSTVTLPKVSRSDLVSHATGRYSGVNKAFNFNLACDPQTAVFVTFEGDVLSNTGTDHVLENKIAGNPNVGIQLLMNNATPVKFHEKFQVAANAQATQVLEFNAYYYYKGGTVSGGGIKSQATFLFDYQ